MEVKQLLNDKKAVAVFVVAVAVVLFLLYLRNRGVNNQTIRGCDPKGCGGFHASRGTREHGGLDIVKKEGQSIYAPIAGQITKHPNPYAGDSNLNGVEITNDKQRTRLFYVEPSVKVGQKVLKGQKIGTAQNVAAKYGEGMTNHVHLELYENGQRVDPSKIIK